MSSPTRSPRDGPETGQETPSPDGSPRNLVRRILQRKDAPDPASLSSLRSSKSVPSSPPSIVERLEGFFTHDLPSSMEVLPTDAQEPSAPTRRDHSEKSARKQTEPKPVSKDNDSMPSEFMAVRSIRLAVKEAIARTQDAYREIETNLKNRAQEFERRHEALAAAAENASANIQQLSASFAKDVTVALEKASQAVLSHSSQKFQEQVDAAVAALNQKLSGERLRFVAETEKQFEELRASRQAFVEDSQKEMAATAQASLETLRKAALEKARAEFEAIQSSLDSATKAAVEKARGDLDALKQGLMAENQKELTFLSRSSVEALSKELVRDVMDQVRAGVANSRPGLIEETQAHLEQVTQASLRELESKATTNVRQAHSAVVASQKKFVDETPKQVAALAQASLETVVKNSVEQGRAELSQMVDEFLAAGVPQIEAELKSLVSRHSEAARAEFAQLAREQAATSRRESMNHSSLSGLSAPPYPPPPPAYTREFTVAERGPKQQVDVGDVWAGLASGLKFGLAAALIVLLLFAVYVSLSPVVRLRPKAPAAFFDESPSWTAKQRAREEGLARSYWDIAVRDVEGKYAFGSSLPADPPDNFAVEEKGPSGAAPKVDAEARARYWAKLRELWPQADSWERISNWNLDWIRNGWNAASAKLAQLFGSSQTSAAPAP